MKRIGHRPWWEDVLRGEKRGLLANSLRRLAQLGSVGFRMGVQGRTYAYARRWLPIRKLPHPTLCVGNITAGGTGKTPLVIRLARDLQKQGLHPAVLLRGYKRERSSSRPVLVRDAHGIRASLADAGDEALELARRLPGCLVGVGADRFKVGQYLLRYGKIDCFVLDDGFQHHRLERDINIVTIDVSDPWGGGHLLPAGLLRESPSALRRADVVVLTRAGSVGPDRLTVLRGEVANFMRPDSALLESRHEPQTLVSLRNDESHPLSRLKNRPVLVVSAIGNPRSFEDTLARLGADIVSAVFWPDHEGDPKEVWSWVRHHKRDDQWVVMTEKDAVRWGGRDLPSDLADSCYALRMDLDITSGLDRWNHLLKLIPKLQHD